MEKKNKYILFLKEFKKKGYKFRAFTEKLSRNSNLILRHDVDFDISYALRIAKIEYKLGVKSNFFFLISSNFYNLINKKTVRDIRIIKKLGHQIGLHFDPSNYKKNKILEGLKIEKDLFEKIFKIKLKIVSFHKPSKIFFNSNKKIFNLSHTYQKKFTKKNIIYFSDSRHKFRYGNPLDSEEFKNKRNLQILIHPIWWINKFNEKTIKKLNSFTYKKHLDLLDELTFSLSNIEINIKKNAKRN